MRTLRASVVCICGASGGEGGVFFFSESVTDSGAAVRVTECVSVPMSLTISVRTTLAEPCFGIGHILSLLCQPASEDMTALRSLVTRSVRSGRFRDEIVSVT